MGSGSHEHLRCTSYGEIEDAPDILAKGAPTAFVNGYNGLNEIGEAVFNPGERVNVYERSGPFDQTAHIVGQTIDHAVGILGGKWVTGRSRLSNAWEFAKDVVLRLGDGVVRDGFDMVTPGPDRGKLIVRRAEEPMNLVQRIRNQSVEVLRN